MSITPYYLSLMDLSNPQDPVAMQAIPCIEEITVKSTGVEDPLKKKGIRSYPDWYTDTLIEY